MAYKLLQLTCKLVTRIFLNEYSTFNCLLQNLLYDDLKRITVPEFVYRRHERVCIFHRLYQI